MTKPITASQAYHLLGFYHRLTNPEDPEGSPNHQKSYLKGVAEAERYLGLIHPVPGLDVTFDEETAHTLIRMMASTAALVAIENRDQYDSYKWDLKAEGVEKVLAAAKLGSEHFDGVLKAITAMQMKLEGKE